MNINELIPEELDVSDEEIDAVETSHSLLALNVKLFTRAVMVVNRIHTLHCFTEDNTLKEFDRDGAIVAGLLSRLDKHITKFHQLILTDELEIASIVARTMIDTGITLCYLIAGNDPVEYQRYIIHSHKRSKDYLDSLAGELANGSLQLPNAGVIVRDIRRSFHEAGIAEGDITSKGAREWDDGGGVRKRARALGWEELYTRVFTLSSDAVHGSWNDLRTFHIEGQGGGRFTVKTEPTGWTYEILVGICDFIAQAINVVAELLAADHPERKGLIEEVTTTSNRMTTLYYNEQLRIAKEEAKVHEASGWELKHDGERLADTFPEVGCLWLTDGILVVVNRPDCHLTMKVPGGKIEHHDHVDYLLLETDKLFFSFDTFVFDIRSPGPEIEPSMLFELSMEYERQRLEAQFDIQLSIESQTLMDVEGRACFYCEIPMPPVEGYRGKAVVRRLYLMTMLATPVLVLCIQVTSELQVERGRRKLMDIAGSVNESPEPIDILPLRAGIMRR